MIMGALKAFLAARYHNLPRFNSAYAVPSLLCFNLWTFLTYFDVFDYANQFARKKLDINILFMLMRYYNFYCYSLQFYGLFREYARANIFEIFLDMCKCDERAFLFTSECHDKEIKSTNCLFEIIRVLWVLSILLKEIKNAIQEAVNIHSSHKDVTQIKVSHFSCEVIVHIVHNFCQWIKCWLYFRWKCHVLVSVSSNF